MNQLSESHYHVLIIDDNPTDIHILKRNLLCLNYATYISTFENSVAAFNFLNKCTDFPEIIFLDLNMPGLNGFEFMKRCSNEFSQPLQFIITSCSDDPRDKSIASQHGNVLHYLVKPIHINDLTVLTQKNQE